LPTRKPVKNVPKSLFCCSFVTSYQHERALLFENHKIKQLGYIYMSNTEVKGRKVHINQPAERVFTAFSDLSNFVKNLPEEHRDKVRADTDTLTVQAQGLELGIRIVERTPFTTLRFEQHGAQTLFPFTFWIHVGGEGENSSTLQLELHAELNMMMKMMLGSKLQEGMDKLTEQFAAGLNGQTPPQ